MKIVKLNKTHNLYYKGYTHAVRFRSCYEPRAANIRSKLYSMKLLYGPDWNSFGKSPYWVGVKDESLLTMVLLTI